MEYRVGGKKYASRQAAVGAVCRSLRRQKAALYEGMTSGVRTPAIQTEEEYQASLIDEMIARTILSEARSVRAEAGNRAARAYLLAFCGDESARLRFAVEANTATQWSGFGSGWDTSADDPESNAWDEYQHAKAQVLPVPYLRS